jgi:hypothetical protein
MQDLDLVESFPKNISVRKRPNEQTDEDWPDIDLIIINVRCFVAGMNFAVGRAPLSKINSIPVVHTVIVSIMEPLLFTSLWAAHKMSC